MKCGVDEGPVEDLVATRTLQLEHWSRLLASGIGHNKGVEAVHLRFFGFGADMKHGV